MSRYFGHEHAIALDQRLLLALPREGKRDELDPRQIVCYTDDGEGGEQAVIMGDDGRMIAASELEGLGIEVLGVLDRGEKTKKEGWRAIGRTIGKTALGAVT